MTGYTAIEVLPVSGNVGAEIRGVDLRARLADEVVAEIRAALLAHGVVFFRDQPLDDDEHIAFASRFGTPNIYPPNRARGVLQPLEWIEDTEASPPKADLWHTDVAFLPEPPDIAVLSMREAAPAGGDTMWVDLCAVHDALSPAMQALIAPLEIDVHPGDDMRRKIELQFGSGVFEKVEAEFAGWRHPLVRVHPETGRRAVFLCGRFMKGIAGMHPDESDLLLDLLRRGLDDPNVQCRWRWRDDDVAMWDERSTNHRALSDHYPAHRLVRRCTVGASPAFGPSDPRAIALDARRRAAAPA